MSDYQPQFAVRGVVFICDYGRLPVTNMYDIDDEPTDDILQACKVVCVIPDGRFIAALVSVGKLVRNGSN